MLDGIADDPEEPGEQPESLSCSLNLTVPPLSVTVRETLATAAAARVAGLTLAAWTSSSATVRA